MSKLNAFDRSKKIWPFIGQVRQQIDPFDPERKPVPLRNATDKKLLPEKKDFVQGFATGDWKYYPASQEYWLADGSKHKTEDGEDLPEGALLEEPSEPEPTTEELKAKAIAQREVAYRTESDPLFLEAIRKDAADDAEGATAAREAGLVAVASIHARFPINVSA
jgi:hypothetical protein